MTSSAAVMKAAPHQWGYKRTEEDSDQQMDLSLQQILNMRQLDYKHVLVSLCVLHVFSVCAGRPIRKRTVSEVQLMHDLGELKQVQERRDWLQLRLQGIHIGPAPWGGRGGEPGRTRRRPRPGGLSDMTPEEIQYALSLLEKLLESKQPS